MKYLIVLLPLIATSMAQRPTYAGLSPKGYPELASRFRDPDQVDTSTEANNGIANRIGDDQPPQNLPTDARGDAVLVNRLNQWPRENRPFWLINAQHIEKHRHPDGTGTIQQGQQQQASTGTQQTGLQPNGGQVQSRFAEPVGSQSRTIRPQSQTGSFAGTRS